MALPPRPDDPEPSSTPVPLRPLTKRQADGERYTRRPEVERQIRTALALEPDELIRRAGITDWETPHPDYLKEECLVYLFDEYRRRGDHQTMKAIYEALLTRCTPIITKRLRKLGDPWSTEAAEEAVDRLRWEILDAMDRGSMLQVAFGTRLKCLLIDLYDKYDRRSNEARDAPHVGHDQIAGEPGGEERTPQYEVAPSGGALPSSPEGLLAAKERRGVVYEALDALPDRRWRDAVVLHHVEGWPIGSQDPHAFTLSKHFDVTPRTVRLWINDKALPFMREWIENHG